MLGHPHPLGANAESAERGSHSRQDPWSGRFRGGSLRRHDVTDAP